jgi:hypothetical protein
MIKRILPFIFMLTLFGQAALGSEFNFNYKNLNTLGALICTQTTPTKKTEQILAHKINVDMRRVGPNPNDKIFEISGSCDINYDLKSKKIVSFGEEFNIEFELGNLANVKGNLGIKEIEVSFDKNSLKAIKITDPLLLTNDNFDLSRSQWASSDRIFNLKNKKLLSVKLARATAAVEKNNTLIFYTNDQTHFYNIWSYQSSGCSHGSRKVSESECSKILKKL